MRNLLALWLFVSVSLHAQDTFAGAMGGIATLSADARTLGTPPVQASSYKPENGASLLLFTGRHFTDYFSAQATYSTNRNDATLSSIDLARGRSSAQNVRATLHTAGFEAMAYFRERNSRLRPYLSAGPVFTWLKAHPGISDRSLGLRVGVGIDWRIHRRIDLRYNFSESLQGNALSAALTPRGERKLANFQNLWGVAFRF
jgi:hypothetical protein